MTTCNIVTRRKKTYGEIVTSNDDCLHGEKSIFSNADIAISVIVYLA